MSLSLNLLVDAVTSKVRLGDAVSLLEKTYSSSAIAVVVLAASVAAAAYSYQLFS